MNIVRRLLLPVVVILFSYTPLLYAQIDYRESSVSELVALLEHEKITVRWKASRELGVKNNSEAIPALVKIFEKEEEPQVRWNIISTLGKFNDPSLIPVFEKALEDDEPWVRFQSLEALEKLTFSSVVSIVSKACEDEDIRVRIKATEILRVGKDASTIPVFVKLLNDSSIPLRRIAILSLGEIGGQAEVEHLRPLLHDEDRWIRSLTTSTIDKLSLEKGEAPETPTSK